MRQHAGNHSGSKCTTDVPYWASWVHEVFWIKPTAGKLLLETSVGFQQWRAYSSAGCALCHTQRDYLALPNGSSEPEAQSSSPTWL